MAKRVFVVKKSLSGNNVYRKLSDYSEGDTVAGVFFGLHECQYGKQNPKIKVIHADFKDGTGASFIGKVLVINHCGSIQNLVDNGEVGQAFQLVYGGTDVISKGPFKGKSFHKFDIDQIELDEQEDVDL